MTKTEKLTAWQTRTSEPNVKYRHTETDTHRLLSKNNYDEEDEYKYNYKDRAAEIRAQNEVQKHTHTHTYCTRILAQTGEPKLLQMSPVCFHLKYQPSPLSSPVKEKGLQFPMHNGPINEH